MSKVKFLSGCQRSFLCELAVSLRPMVFSPADPAPPGFLYIIHRGVAVYQHKIINAGGCWGEDMILMSEHLKSRYSARALSYLEVYYATREELLSLAERFPPSHRRIRRYAVFLALRREIIKRARFVHNIHERELCGNRATTSATLDQKLKQATLVEEKVLLLQIAPPYHPFPSRSVPTPAIKWAHARGQAVTPLVTPLVAPLTALPVTPLVTPVVTPLTALPVIPPAAPGAYACGQLVGGRELGPAQSNPRVGH